MQAIIEAEDIGKDYRGTDNQVVKALRGVNLEVGSGEFLGIIGPSGSGKTTLLSIMGCLESPTSGFLKVLGRDVLSLSDRDLSKIRLHEIGFIYQEHNLLPSLTIAENIELPMSLANRPKDEREKRTSLLLETVDLLDLKKRLPGELSRGQRQRIAALRALANDPKIIIGDEPTSDLDRRNAEILLDFLKKINSEEGPTVIVASTNLGFLERYISKELRLVDGVLKEDHT